MTRNDTPMFERRPLARPNDDIEDQGLVFDMQTILTRRRLLGVLGIGVGSAALAACAPGGESATSAAGTLQELNTQTAGPYPGDGSNGPDVLDETGVERRDLTTSVDGNGSVEGAKLTLTMNLIDISNGNAPLTNAAVYVWHCNAAGEYSMYSDGVTDQTWLRGVKVTDSNGQVTFDSIVPGCYTGRWPHIHFEVFKSIDEITDATNNVLTSQIVVPEDVARAVYEDSKYDGSTNNLNQVSLEPDNVLLRWLGGADPDRVRRCLRGLHPNHRRAGRSDHQVPGRGRTDAGSGRRSAPVRWPQRPAARRRSARRVPGCHESAPFRRAAATHRCLRCRRFLDRPVGLGRPRSTGRGLLPSLRGAGVVMPDKRAQKLCEVWEPLARAGRYTRVGSF